MPNRTKSRALALDFGRVLTLDPDKSTFDALLSRWGIPAEVFSQAWAIPRHEYDRGTLDSTTYWKTVLTRCSADLDENEIVSRIPELVDADFASWAVPRTRLHRIVQKALNVQTPVAIVSNMPGGMGERFVENWPWLARIPYRFFSGEIGLVKPEDEFYHHALQQTGWAPQQVLFVDDLPVNIEAASRLGFNTLLFTGKQSDLEAVGAWCQL